MANIHLAASGGFKHVAAVLAFQIVYQIPDGSEIVVQTLLAKLSDAQDLLVNNGWSLPLGSRSGRFFTREFPGTHSNECARIYPVALLYEDPVTPTLIRLTEDM